MNDEYPLQEARDQELQKTTDKWSKLLTGISDDKVKMMSAFLLENESNYLKQTKNDLSVGPFLKFVFPLIRKDSYYNPYYDPYPQPMPGPIGGIAFYRPRYDSSKKLSPYDLSDLNNEKVSIPISDSLSSSQGILDGRDSADYEQMDPYPDLVPGYFADDVVENPKKSLLAPDCIPCGGEGGRHKLGCPVNRDKK